MADDASVYVLDAPEIRAFLANNGTSIGELLRAEGIAVEERRGANPARQGEGATRELVTILLASAKIIAALAPVISTVLGRLVRKDIVVEEWELLPVLDGSGAPVLDKDGRPLTYWAKRHKILNEPKSGNETEEQRPVCIRITFRDK